MIATEVLVIVLGGGAGTRLFPLTRMRSKPAVPIGGKYRLIDIPVSNCLHADLRRIFVLTQFNSASLNQHIAQTYRLDMFSHGFVEILAAEQTPENTNWFQGTADAVRQAMRHFVDYRADYYVILAGDHLYRMNFGDLIESHIESHADITIAAQPVPTNEAPAMGIFRFDHKGQIVGFEEKPTLERLAAIGSSVPPGAAFAAPMRDKPFVASMGIYVFSRDVLIEVLEQHPGIDFGKEIIPAALGTRLVHAYLHQGYWADVGTIESFYNANILLTEPNPPFSFYHAERPIFTHPRFLPTTRLDGCRLDDTMLAEGCYLERCQITQSVVGIRSQIGAGSRVNRSVLLGADFYEAEGEAEALALPGLGLGRNVTLNRVIVDKNARIGDGVRLVNERGLVQEDGNGYYIREGIIIVPKDGVIPAGTVV